MTRSPQPTPSRLPVTTRRSLFSIAGAGLMTAMARPAWAADDVRPAAARSPMLTAFDRQIVGKVDIDEALTHLHHLSENIGQRYSGTPGEVDAAHYIANVLDGYGYGVELEPFAVPDRRLGELSSASLDQKLCWGVGAATRGRIGATVTGGLVLAPTATPASLPADLTGKVVMRVVLANSENITALAQAAAARGAVGFIATRVDSVYPRQTSASAPSLSADVSIPVVGVGQAQKHAILAAHAASPLSLTVTTTLYSGLTSYNVIARLDGKKGPDRDGRQDVMVSGHYDSVIGAKGANDDGSGTVLTMELARVMRNLPTRSNLVFSLWGSEELGLVGSRYHVAQYSAAQKARLRGVFQNDMVGTSWDPAEKYWVLSYDGLPNVVNAEVLAAGERLGYRSRMSDVTTRGSSDHQSFQEVGIPSGNFSWRGVESPALLEPEYHSADDTIEANISLERLTVSMELIGCATYALARA